MMPSPLTLKEKGLTANSSWLLKLNRPLAFLIVFFSPTQLAKHFWPSFSFIHGIRIDYLAPQIAFFDLLSLFFLLTLSPSHLRRSFTSLSPLFLFLALHLVVFPFSFPTLFYSLRLALYLLVSFHLLKLYRSRLPFYFLFPLIFQVLLAFYQVVTNQAGTFTMLGERLITLNTLGAAKTSLFGTLTLRAYGTFSHPNALAGWLLLVNLLLFFFRSSLPHRLFYLTTLFVFLGILLTQSRLALFAFILSFIFFFSTYFALRSLRLASLLFLIGFTFFFFSRPLHLSLRLFLSQLSLNFFFHHPLFGLGLNHTLPHYPPVPSLQFLQPDHNSFTLLLAQLGLFGLLSLFLFLRSLKSKLTPPFFILLFLAFFDHYLLTSQQGLFISLLFLYASQST